MWAMDVPYPLKLHARLYCGPEIAMGPGKAGLLEAIASCGSISGAGRMLGMSYRRTWLLVDTMNRCWAAPLVEATAGGKRGGGARLTALGAQVLADYRSLQDRLAAIARDDLALMRLRAALRDAPAGSQHD